MNDDKYDLIIIGAGPAGLTAALYAGRFRLKTLVLEKMVPGGQIILSSTIENFPGFPGSLSTQELIDRLKRQVNDLGINMRNEESLKIETESVPDAKTEAAPDAKNFIYKVKTGEKTYQAKTIIIATGAQSKRLGIKGEDRLIGKGVSYCATCDGPLFRGKDVAVIGAGDRAIEEAIFLSSYAQSVTVIHRRQELRASGILQEKAKQNPKIKFILDSIVEEIVGQDKVEAVKIKNAKTNMLSSLSCQGIFIFAGISPNSAFLKNQIEMDEAGFIITDQQMQTSREGIFACGDCRKKSLYQVITACGEAAVAADSAHKYLLKYD